MAGSGIQVQSDWQPYWIPASAGKTIQLSLKQFIGTVSAPSR
jgi:hypothetical protein